MGKQYGFYADTSRCIKCWACEVACKQWNDIKAGTVSRRKVHEIDSGTFPDTHRTFVSMSCMHCEKPACVPCCPTGASQQDADGTVWIEYDKCMACLACVNACPYGMRDQSKLQPRLHRFVRKCTFCRDRRENEPGRDPYCVQTCHQKARIFGDLDDPNSEVSKLIGSAETFRLLEDMGTGPQIYYIPDLGGTA